MKSFKGYTFVEIMVVVALLGIIMVGVISLFLTNLRLSNQATAMSRVKQEGDYTSSTIERLVRYAKSIESACDGNTYNSLVFTDTNDNAITIGLTGTVLEINGEPMTSDVVTVDNVSFICQGTPGGDLVLVSYRIRDTSVTTIDETFTTRVVLRNKK